MCTGHKQGNARKGGKEASTRFPLSIKRKYGLYHDYVCSPSWRSLICFPTNDGCGLAAEQKPRPHAIADDDAAAATTADPNRFSRKTG